MQEMKDKIESLQQELQEVESSYKFQVDRIDSRLGKIKDSLLETLSLLQPPPRKTLRKRITGYFVPTWDWTRQNGVNIFLFLAFVFLLYSFYYSLSQLEGWHKFPDKKSPVVLTMTQQEYDLLRSAERLVNKDVGKYQNIGDALSAFYAESPISVRDSVIERLGSVGSLEDLPIAMENILGRVVVTGSPPRTGGSVEGSFENVSPSIIENSSATDEDEPDTPNIFEESEKEDPPDVSEEKTENNLAGNPATKKTEYQRQRIFRRR
jgi:hypothetical protein